MKRIGKHKSVLRIVILSLIFVLSFSIGIGWALKNLVSDEIPGGGGHPGIPLISQISTENEIGNKIVYDMQLIGTKIFTGGHGWNFTGGSVVYDVSNPSHPLKIYEIPTYPWFSAIEVVDDIYYGANHLGVSLYDVSGNNPVYVGNIPYSGGVKNDILVQNDKAYLLNQVDSGQNAGRSGSLTIFDVSDLQNVSVLGTAVMSDYPIGAHPPNPTNVIINSHYAYVGKEGLRIFDVSDPASPAFVSTIDVKRGGLQVHQQDDMQLVTVGQGGRIYKAHQQFGILIFVVDLLTPTKPYLEHVITPPLIATGGNIAFDIIGNKMFVVTAADRKFKVLDITNIDQPVVLASASVDGEDPSTVEIEIDQTRKLAFVSTTGVLHIFDIRNFLP